MKWIPYAVLLLSLAGLCGCAHEYLLKLDNGDQILSVSKPQLQGASYHFTDQMGGKHIIPQSRVAKIRAVSVVPEEEKSAAPDSLANPKKPKHWYFLWLA